MVRARLRCIPYRFVDEVVSDKNYELVVKLNGPVEIKAGDLMKAEEYFTYDETTEAPVVEVDETFRVVLYFGKNKRLRRKLIKQFENDHI